MKKNIKSCLVGLVLTSMCVLGYASTPRPMVSPSMPPVIINENTLIQTPLGIVSANKINEKDLPTLLTPWVNWIRAKNLDELCLLNTANEKQCVFAPIVEIGENESNFDFKISGTSYLNEFWIKVPSGQSQKVWPENILVNDKKGQVLEKDGFALVKISKGDFNIVFTINKQELKKSPYLLLAQNFLIIKNKTTTPWITENNQLLWLTKNEDKEQVSSAKNEEFRVYRKLIDGIPLRLETRIQASYSGQEKEVFLGKVLPEDFKLLEIQSDVSINQREDGFYIKINSGEHWIIFNSYSFNNNKNISTKELIRNTTNEFWSVQNNVNIRQMDIKSAQAVDPKQVFVPKDWQSFPAYNVKEVIEIETIRRGINIQENLSYSANRSSWYGFNNDTILHVDNMSFNNEGKPFMEFDSSITPKEFSLIDKPQMIVENNKKQGIVLRQGQYPASLHAETSTNFNSKFISDSKQNLESWNLTVAPRHRLLHATGVDRAIDSWTDKWNLYTIFAIFLITLGFYKLFGLPLAILSFSSIFLFQSDPFLSWTIWPALLLLMALLKVLPNKNKFTKLVRYTTGVLVLGVSFIFITFTVQELRYIVNGSLEKDVTGHTFYRGDMEQAAPAPAPIAAMAPPAESSNTLEMDSLGANKDSRIKSLSKSIKSPVSQAQFEQEVKSIETQIVQVSTGQPAWSGISYSILPSSLMEEKVNLYVANPWLVNIGAIIQILNLLIVWIFLIMYTLNIYQKQNIIDKIPFKFKNNPLIKPFLGEQK